MSWTVLAVLALVVAVCESHGSHHGSHHQKDCKCNYNIPRGYGQSTAAQGAQRLLQLRVDSQEQRLAKAYTEGHTLQTKVDQILSTREKNHRRVKQILQRIYALEADNNCEDESSFGCRDGSGRCISRLLVCDTVKDCNNGEDEDKDLCAALEPGTVWEAHPKAEDAGCAKRVISKFVVTLQKVVNNVYLPGRPHLEAGFMATSSVSGKQVQEYFSVKGTWDPSYQKLVFSPPETHDPLGIVCQFDGIDSSHCEAAFYNIHTHETCGHFTFTKV